MSRKRELEATTDTTADAAKTSKRRKHNHVEPPSLTTKKKHKKHKHKEHKHKEHKHKKHKGDKEHKKDKKKKKKKSKSSDKDDTSDSKVQSSTKDISSINATTTTATKSSTTTQKEPEKIVFNNRIQSSLVRDYVDDTLDKTPLYKTRIVANIPKVHHDFFISDSDSDSDDDVALNTGTPPTLEWHKRYFSGVEVREKRLEWPTVENGLWSLQERVRLEKRVKRVARVMKRMQMTVLDWLTWIIEHGDGSRSLSRTCSFRQT